MNVAIFSANIIVAGNLGGFATISMAGLAYRRFRRDLVLSAIQNSIESATDHDITARVSGLKPFCRTSPNSPVLAGFR